MLVAVGLTRRRADRLLACGLAGSPLRTSSSSLYDREAVAALCARPFVDPQVLHALADRGMVVCRRDLDVSRPQTELLADVSSGWHDVSPWTMAVLSGVLSDQGAFAFVATVRGFVVLGADLVAVGPGVRGGPQLTLVDPGSWFGDHVEGRRLRSGPGRPWQVRWPDGPRGHGKMAG
jgi:hypothetical protein